LAYVGDRQLTANEPISGVADLDGLRLRLPSGEISAKTWQALGADVASVAFTELYLALQTGTVDAQENPPNFIRAQKFYEVQDYLITTDHRPQLTGFFMSADIFGDLDEGAQAAITEAAAETVAWTSQRAAEIQKEDVAWLTSEGGMELIEFDHTGVQDAIRQIPQEVLGEDGMALYERIRATEH
jgi:TRAP-type C4-dicarboxylate transport system substrate-binding protein